MTEAGERVSRLYGGFKGVDFRSAEANLSRSPDSLNVWKDYRETESIRTRPGVELKHTFTDPIYGIYFFEVDDGELMLVHSGKKLYSVENGEVQELSFVDKNHNDIELNEAPSQGFVYEGNFYFLDGKNYMNLDGVVEGYVPTTSIGRKPKGGGTIHEDVNMLSDYRINTFLAD
jgi:hypothetical protein